VGEHIISDLMREKGYDGFEHELNSLRIVDFLAEHGKGLNLTYAVRDGIACHNGEHFLRNLRPVFAVRDLSQLRTRSEAIPASWEAVVVRFSDQIAYLGRDYEDACRLSIIQPDMIPPLAAGLLGRKNGEIINTLVNDIIDHSDNDQGISFSPRIFEAVEVMRDFNYQFIYRSPLLQGYEKYFKRLLRLIVDYLQGMLDSYGMDESKYVDEKNMLAVGFYQHLYGMREPYLRFDGDIKRIVFDYVAGMSDNFCLDCANEILKPEHLNDRIEQSLTGKWFDAK
jgi:dGTPase